MESAWWMEEDVFILRVVFTMVSYGHKICTKLVDGAFVVPE